VRKAEIVLGLVTMNAVKVIHHLPVTRNGRPDALSNSVGRIGAADNGKSDWQKLKEPNLQPHLMFLRYIIFNILKLSLQPYSTERNRNLFRNIPYQLQD
jgi:hypothetical protein